MSNEATITHLRPISYFITDPATGEVYEIDNPHDTTIPLGGGFRTNEQIAQGQQEAVLRERSRIREWAATRKFQIIEQDVDVGPFVWHSRAKDYNQALDDLLDFLREEPK